MQTAMFWWLHCDQMDIHLCEEVPHFFAILGTLCGLSPLGDDMPEQLQRCWRCLLCVECEYNDTACNIGT